MAGAREPSLLFVHGAGGFHEDQPLARALADSAQACLVMPRLPDADMTVEAWAAPLRTALDGMGPEDFVIGHSFGASILLAVLAESQRPVSRPVLLAMPHWGQEGWDVEDYVPAGPRRPSPSCCTTARTTRWSRSTTCGSTARTCPALSSGRTRRAGTSSTDSQTHSWPERALLA